MVNNALKEGDVVMCKVIKIENTSIFLELEDKTIGSMVLSEVSAGRIRNLREYVSPNKMIVCKILKITKNGPELSLRRVLGKEREFIQEKNRKEKTFKGILKSVVKDIDSLINKIREDYDLLDFMEEVKIDPKLLEKYLPKKESEQISTLLAQKKEKEKEAEKIITLKSFSELGLDEIKQALSIESHSIRYLGSSKFSIKEIGKDFKEANSKLDAVIHEIEKRAKEKKILIEIK
ncbi:MAG: hypothetical protein AABW80_03765 [Nanoarchaeota archaeon]